jgi:hypothetical protein
VINWAEKAADQWDGQGELLAFPQSTPFVRFVLDEMRTTYVPYILENASAMAAGAKAFHVDIYGEDVSYLCRPYPEKSRQMINDKILSELETNDRESVSNWLSDLQLDVCFG